MLRVSEDKEIQGEMQKCVRWASNNLPDEGQRTSDLFPPKKKAWCARGASLSPSEPTLAESL